MRSETSSIVAGWKNDRSGGLKGGGKCGDGISGTSLKSKCEGCGSYRKKTLQKIVEESSDYLMMVMKEQRF